MTEEKTDKEAGEVLQYMEWGRQVCVLLPKNEVLRTIKWWQSKKAKLIWTTKGARLKRKALIRACAEKYGE